MMRQIDEIKPTCHTLQSQRYTYVHREHSQMIPLYKWPGRVIMSSAQYLVSSVQCLVSCVQYLVPNGYCLVTSVHCCDHATSPAAQVFICEKRQQFLPRRNDPLVCRGSAETDFTEKTQVFMQYSTVQYSTVQYSTVQYSTKVSHIGL